MNVNLCPYQGKLLRVSLFLSALLLFVSFGCKKVIEEPGMLGLCPVVVSTNPVNGGTGIGLTTKVEAIFNEEMNPASFNANSFTVFNGNVPIAGTISFNGITASFVPATSLAPNTTFSATIKAGVVDAANNALPADYAWSFTTGAGPDNTAPTVTSTDPVNAKTNVALNAKISATFSELMDSMSVVSSYSLANTTLGGTAVLGAVKYSGQTAVFTPLANLLPNTTYTGTVSTGSKDLMGNTLAASFTWSFTTGTNVDGTVPSVVATVPSNGATGVNVNTKILATFSEAMDPASVNFTTFMVKQGNTAVAGVVTYNGVTATFSPSTNLTASSVYTATVTASAKDLAGNPMAGDYVWTFTTGTTSDAVKPTVTATDPVNNATSVAFDKKITATFSEAMDPLTISTATYTLKNGSSVVPGTVTYSGTTATFNPNSALAPSVKYTATITTGAKDLAGNALNANYSWVFTTDLAPDIEPPAVASTDPAANAVNVAINKKISATFNEVMDAASVTAPGAFTLRNGTTELSGTVTYTGKTVTFSPAVSLLFNTTYTATIAKGVKDVAGNALVSDYTWQFTTVPPTVTPPSNGTLSIFGAIAGTAGMTNTGINTVINGSSGSTAPSTLITGFHEGLSGDVYTETTLNKGNVTGRIYTAPPAPGTATSFGIATQALADATRVYADISPAGRPGGTDPGAGELGGLTLAAGVYRAAGGAFSVVNGNLILDAKGDPNALWIFQATSSLTIGSASAARSVTLINGAQAKNVFWYVGSAATINGAGGGTMTGTIISSAGITISTAGKATQTVINGRVVSLNASVTMVNTTINVPN